MRAAFAAEHARARYGKDILAEGASSLTHAAYSRPALRRSVSDLAQEVRRSSPLALMTEKLRQLLLSERSSCPGLLAYLRPGVAAEDNRPEEDMLEAGAHAVQRPGRAPALRCA